MGLSGTLHTFPLGELLQWMGSAGKTGILAVRGERYTKRLFFRDGVIVSSSSDDPTEHLGQFLLSHGRITEEDLRKGLETQGRTKVLLGRILIMVGLINEEELRKLLAMKAEETIFSLFFWEDAHFEFNDEPLARDLHVTISLPVQDVLLKGLTLIDELRHIRQVLGSSATVLEPTDAPAPELPQRSLEKRILDLVDGERSITDICLAVHASEFTVSKHLFDFFESGVLKLLKKIESTGPMEGIDRFHLAPDELVARGRDALESGKLDDAVELLRRAVESNPLDLECKKLYDDAAVRFRDHAYGNSMKPDKVPVLLRDFSELTAEELHPEEGFLLSRINGSWDLKSIIDISPLGEVEALLIMKRLLDRGIIELR